MRAGLRRKARFAGSFYPDDVADLRCGVASYVESFPAISTPCKVCAIVSPHAGYVYSGPVAGYGYRSILSSKVPRAVFLLGSSHRVLFEGIALGSYTIWETPLGEVRVSALSEEMSKKTQCVMLDSAHEIEHSLEVQLPFLQYCYGEKAFEIVPMLVSDTPFQNVAELLESCLTDDDLLVVSSDLSHYLPYKIASIVDGKTVGALKDLNIKEMDAEGDACGKIPILAAMTCARSRKWEISEVYYRNSGDTAGEKDAVVGYASAYFCVQK